MKIIVGKNDLATIYPEIAKEASGWDPSSFTTGSNLIKLWNCKKKHQYLLSIKNRVKGSGCPYCSNQKVLSGFNDLATTHPELAAEADGWDPTKVIAGTNKKLAWRCKQDHRWKSLVNSRSSQSRGCPVCVNQKVLSGFNDLATTHPELAAEADGWDPTKVIAGSHKRLKWKCKLGHVWESTGTERIRNGSCPICNNQKVLSGFNDLATTHPELAAEANGWDPTKVIAGSHKRLKWKCKLGHVWVSTVNRRMNGRSCHVCVNQKVLSGFNDLATTHPELAAEANGWDPTEVIAGTGKKLDWKCKQGHLWNSVVNSRIASPGCPVCANQKVLSGFNDLATTHPELAAEANGWDPTKVIAGTNKKFEWRCQQGHIWSAQSSNRVQGRGCPSCAKSGFDPNKESYVYFLLHPVWELYQIGITNFPDNRLKSHSKNGFELLELRGPMNGHTAQELETALLRYLKSEKADLLPEHIAGKFDGYSESWTIDSYKVNNLKELIDKASEAGF
jgi:hypothetical protein